MRHGVVLSALLALLIGAACVQAEEWNEPENGLLSEKQVTSYIAISKELFELLKASGKAADNAKSTASALVLGMQTDAKYQAILKRHGMGQDQFTWVTGKVWEAFSVAEMEKVFDGQVKEEMAKGAKESESQLAVARKKLEQYQAAQKAGQRVMDKEARQQAIEEAKAERQSAQEEAKDFANQAKEAQAEAAQAEKEAKEAEAAAKNPPGGMEKEERADFIKEKQEEAKAARQTAQEARQRAADAAKSEKQATARAAAAAKRLADPAAAVSGDDKADIAKENAAAIESAQAEIQQLEKALEILKESAQASTKMLDEIRGKVPAQNIALLKKHSPALKAAWEIKEEQH